MTLVLLFACTEPLKSEPGPGDDTAAPQEPELPVGVSTLAGAEMDQPFREPKDVALAPDGSLVIVEWSSTVRVVQSDGSVSELPAANSSLTEASGVAVDAEGAVYVSDPALHCIFRIADGQTTVFAGTCGSPGFKDGGEALFQRPRGLAFDDQGNLLVTDTENMGVRSVDPSGVASTVTDQLYYPFDVVYTDSGLFVVGLDHCVRRVSGGAVEDVAGLCQNWGNTGEDDGLGVDARFDTPMNLAVDADGALLIADTFNDRLRRVDPGTGEVTTLTGIEPGFADGLLDEALFDAPRGLAVDAWGNIYIADSLNHRIRVVVRD